MKNIQSKPMSGIYPMSKETMLYLVSQGHQNFYPPTLSGAHSYYQLPPYESLQISNQNGLKQEALIKVEPGVPNCGLIAPPELPHFQNKLYPIFTGASINSANYPQSHLPPLVGLHGNAIPSIYKYPCNGHQLQSPFQGAHGCFEMSPSSPWGKAQYPEEGSAMAALQGEAQLALSKAAADGQGPASQPASPGENKGRSTEAGSELENAKESNPASASKAEKAKAKRATKQEKPKASVKSKRQREESQERGTEAEAEAALDNGRRTTKNRGALRELPERRAKRDTRGSKTEQKIERPQEVARASSRTQNADVETSEKPAKEQLSKRQTSESKTKKESPPKQEPIEEEEEDVSGDDSDQDDDEHQRKMQRLNQNETFVEIRGILKFLSENVSKQNKELLKEKLHQYKSKNHILAEIYESLMNKYLNSNKTKEEKIKFVLRKSFNFLKDRIRKASNLPKKELELKFFQSYFSEKAQSSQYFSTASKRSLSKTPKDEKITIKDMIMPFRKKSLNKTMNNNFLKRIFSFDRYAYEFVRFIDDFRIYALKDNEKKLDNTAHRILLLIDKNNEFKGIPYRKFKRMPWLHSWIDDTENIAQKLTEYADPNVLKLHSGKLPTRFLAKKKTGDERSRSF